MDPRSPQGPASPWVLARRQHGVVSRAQLLDLGVSSEAVTHRIRKGKLHPVHRGVYALGRPELTDEGRWMAAVLACGPGAVLSHMSAAGLYALFPGVREISISVPKKRDPRPPDLVVHRVELPNSDVTRRDGVPITSPARTLVDIAAELSDARLERAVNQADKLSLIGPDELRAYLAKWPGRPGVPALRTLLDRDTFALTESDLEQRFLRIVRQAGLSLPETGVRLNGFVVDFFWRDLGLVVETDGLTYHRTALQQARDRRRDQAHTAAGLTALRFTHRQVRYESQDVRRTLAAVAERLRRGAAEA